MKRGEIWTLRADGTYLTKPRPALVVQVKKISKTESIIVCLFTSEDRLDVPTRVQVEPSSQNGLKVTSYIMVEKVTSLLQSELGTKIGVLEDSYLSAATEILKDLLGF